MVLLQIGENFEVEVGWGHLWLKLGRLERYWEF